MGARKVHVTRKGNVLLQCYAMGARVKVHVTRKGNVLLQCYAMGARVKVHVTLCYGSSC